MWMIAAEGNEQRAGRRDVVNEATDAGQQAWILETLDALADQLRTQFDVHGQA